MTTVEQIMVTAVSWAIMGVAMLAWDFGRRWLQELAANRASNETLNAVLARQDALDQTFSASQKERKAMAEDWMKKFIQLERDWQKLKEHADAQYAGARAQFESTQPRGFHR